MERTSKFGSYEGAEAWGKPRSGLREKLLSFAVSTSKFGSFEGAEAWGKPRSGLREKNY